MVGLGVFCESGKKLRKCIRHPSLAGIGSKSDSAISYRRCHLVLAKQFFNTHYKHIHLGFERSAEKTTQIKHQFKKSGLFTNSLLKALP